MTECTMYSPRTFEEVKLLVNGKVQENLHLEYKSSELLIGNPGLKIARTISSFAHSDGGAVIYGVIEKDGLPDRVDSGVSNAQRSRESLEQLVTSHITPNIDGLGIYPISVSKHRSIFVVEVPKSLGKLHQCSDHKYYKRHNFQSQPMEHYEIKDVRNRSIKMQRLVNIELELTSTFFYLAVSNPGSSTATHVSFSFPDELNWYGETKPPPLIRNGAEYLAPGQKFLFRLARVNSLFSTERATERRFTASVKYVHPDFDTIVSHQFHFDVENYYGTVSLSSDVLKLERTLDGQSRKLIRELEKVGARLEDISQIAKPAGLYLSTSTLRNLSGIFERRDGLEKIDPFRSNQHVFREVLGVDWNLAFDLEMHFLHPHSSKLEDLEGMTPDVLARLKDCFHID